MAEQAAGSMTQPGTNMLPDNASTAARLRAAVTDSIQFREQFLQGWRDNVNMRVQRVYGGQLGDTQANDRLSSPEDWARTKQKVAQLMFKVPRVRAVALRPEYRQSEAKVTSLINKKMSKEVKTHVMIDECLSDVVNASGIMVSIIGVEQYSRPTELQNAFVGVAGAENATDPSVAAQAPNAASPVPAPQPVNQPIATRFYWERTSPAAFLWPREFVGSNFDEADWLGYETWIPLVLAKKFYNLPDDVKTSARPQLLSNELYPDTKFNTGGYVKLTVVWYKACRFDDDAFHPDHLRRLIFVDGVKEPVASGDTNWQQWVDPIPPTPAGPPTPNQPQGTPGTSGAPGHFLGIKNFPIRVQTLVYVSDVAVPPSDSEAGRPQVKELLRTRTQYLRQRDQSLPLRWYDTNRLDTMIADAIRAGVWQDMIPTNGPGDRVVGEVARASYPRENYEFANILRGDLDRSWALSNNGLGITNSGERSATEITAIQSASQIRLDYEKDRVNRYIADGAEVLFHLMQRFMTEADYVQVVGQNGAKEMVGIQKADIEGQAFEFEFVPDTSERVDLITKQNNSLKLYNLFANSPSVNRSVLEADVLMSHGYDPAEILVQPQDKKESPNISYRFGTEDMLNPFVVALIQKAQGITKEEIGAAAMLIADSMKQFQAAQAQLGIQIPPAALEAEGQADGGDGLSPAQAQGEPVTPPETNAPILKRGESGTRLV